jgi:hypothetical protein
VTRPVVPRYDPPRYGPSGGSRPVKARGGAARPVGDLVTGALRALGVPTRAASRRMLDAWGAIADPAWAGKARPTRLVGGTLVVTVASAPLREELAQFHAARLLEAVQRALPDVGVAALRFEAGTAAESGADIEPRGAAGASPAARAAGQRTSSPAPTSARGREARR